MPHSASPGMLSPIEVRVSNLLCEDTIRAKNILKGVLVAKAEDIDIASLPPKEVIKTLEHFGESEGII